jgi:type II secretory ATPase GspE/PulE/Tfp pilus assembly ATPase PilB-like protein
MGSDLNTVYLKKQNKEIVKDILQHVRTSENIDASLPELINDLKTHFDCDAITLFALDQPKHQLYSIPLSGIKTEIRVDISHTSLAGFVAGTGKSINVANVKDPNELSKYHPQLTHGSIWDDTLNYNTQSMLAAPLSFNQKLIGVLEVINKNIADKFSEEDLKLAGDISSALGSVLARLYNDKIPKNESKPPIPPNSFDYQNDYQKVFQDNKLSDERQVITPVKKKSISTQEPTKFSYLIQQGLITEEKLTASLIQAQKNAVDEEIFLLETTGLKRKELGFSLAEFYNVPYYGYHSSIILPKKILGGLNKNFLANNYWIPIQSNESKIVILTNDPTSADIYQNIKQIFQKKEIEFKVGLKTDIIDFLNSLLEQGETHFEQLKSEQISNLITTLQEENEEALLEPQSEQSSEETTTIKDVDSTIVRLVNKILMDAYERGVSDIHIEPGTGKDDVLIRFRKDGECINYENIPYLYKQAIISRVKIMARLDIAERRIPQDGKIKMRYENNDIEFRVATCPTVGENEDAVLRILAQSKPHPIDSINFNDRNIKLIKENIVKPYGLILVVGPTGSGKTTTLHSCLGYINTPSKKIWTAEDPVEITQKGLRQVQMLDKKGLNFARAMRSFLRGDPDVIMVGEMRDAETAAIGLEASLTGHLVCSTLHTNSATETIIRLLDMGMNPLNFSDALLLIVAQRLVRTLCKECCEDYHPSREEFDILVNEYGEESFQKLGIKYNSSLTLKKPVGCWICNNSGYAGRIPIHEVLEATPTLKRQIIKQASVDELRKKAFEEGMTSLKQDGIQKVLNGHCDLRQVLSVCMV